RAYPCSSEVLDRGGSVRGTLPPRLGRSGPIPARRPRGTATMEEMGMSMEGGGDMSGMKAAMERNAKAGSKPMSREGCATLAVMDGTKLVGLLTVEKIGE